MVKVATPAGTLTTRNSQSPVMLSKGKCAEIRDSCAKDGSGRRLDRFGSWRSPSELAEAVQAE